MYSGAVTDEHIRDIFAGAGDFLVRQLRCGTLTLYAYAIDGLTSGADTSEYVIRPITDNLAGENMQQLYDRALKGNIYNSVADPLHGSGYGGKKARQRLLRGPVPGGRGHCL